MAAGDPLRCVALFQDKPLHVVDAQIRDDVLPGSLLAWTGDSPWHGSPQR